MAVVLPTEFTRMLKGVRGTDGDLLIKPRTLTAPNRDKRFT